MKNRGRLRCQQFSLNVIFCIIGIVSIFSSVSLDTMGINPTLIAYDDFVGDILNAVSIMTGFLGTLIAIVLSLPDDLKIVKDIRNSKQATTEFILVLIYPFIAGVLLIILAIYYRLYLNNTCLFNFGGSINTVMLFLFILFIGLFCLMVYVSIRMISANEKEVEDIINPKIKK